MVQSVITPRPPAPPPAGPSAARDLNTARVLALVRDQGPLTQAELIRRSGLARPTVAAIARQLQEAAVLVEAGRAPDGSTGRPGSLLQFDPRCATAAVARMLPRSVEVWIVDCDGEELGRSRLTRPGPAAGRPDRLAAELTRLSAELGVPRPGSVGMLLVGRLPASWAVLEDRLAAPVTVLNPTAAAALGVARAGRHADALVVFLDHGIGVGIVCGGEVLLGADARSGELGHCRVPGVERRCRCGRTGCVETVAAGWFLRERAAQLLGSTVRVPTTVAGLEGLGHAGIDRLLAEAAEQLGLATSWLVNTVNPRAVLLGGTPFAAGADRFLATFTASVRRHALVDHAEHLVVDVASPTADIDGAAQAALDRLVIV